MKSRLAASDALYLKPLLFGLDRMESPFDLTVDFPANTALKMSQRSEEIRSAFLSPLDYARHGAEYCIVPGICTAATRPSGTIQLVLKSDVHSINRVAIDIRYTSEIILAKIILEEKYRTDSSRSKLQFIPMQPNLDAMLSKADAALLVNESLTRQNNSGFFTLDLAEEWNDMTDLPYVHGFWVGREGELTASEADALITAKKEGILQQAQIAAETAPRFQKTPKDAEEYFSSFTYDFGEKEEESIAEYIHYAYFHGVIGDVPEIRFFDLASDTAANN